MVNALSAAVAKGPEGFADGLDEALASAFRASLRATLSASHLAWAERDKQPGTVCHRTVGIVTCAGRVAVRYPYAPGKGVGKALVEKLAARGRQEGDAVRPGPRTTPAARRAVAEAGVRLGSYAEARECLAPGRLDAEYKRFRRRLKTWGGESMLRGLAEGYGQEAVRALSGEALAAWNYLEERAWMMDYRQLRREGYFIGSGLIESACKMLVAARCKLAGMHWRHHNAAAIALLRGTLRSNFLIAV